MNQPYEVTFHNATLAHRLGIDDMPAPVIELPRCESCGKACAELTACVWEADLLVGPCCVEPEEPECECRQIDVDAVDPRGCELHNSQSRYNQMCRRVQAVEREDVLASDEQVERDEFDYELPTPRMPTMSELRKINTEVA